MSNTAGDQALNRARQRHGWSGGINNMQTKGGKLTGKNGELVALREQMFYEKDPTRKLKLETEVLKLQGEIYGVDDNV